MEENKEINIAEHLGLQKGGISGLPSISRTRISEASLWNRKSGSIRLFCYSLKSCGGATAMPPVRGAWLNEERQDLVVEEPVLVYTFIDSDKFAQRIDEIVSLVHEIGKKTRQGQMAIEFNQTFYLIDIKVK